MNYKQKRIFIGELCIILFLLCIIGFLWNKKSQLTNETKELTQAGWNTNENAVKELTGQNEDTNAIASNISEQTLTQSGTITMSAEEQAIVKEEVVIDLKEDGVKPLTGKNIVVFGDSIWNTYRNQTGIAYQVAKETGATIYNCAINGTRASTDDETVDVNNNWHSKSLSTMVYITMGIIEPEEQIKGEYAIRVIDKVDWNTIDYVLISYGIQDYLFNATIESEEGDYYGLNTYMGALRHAAMRLHELYPDLKIVFLSPTYCDIWVGPEDCTTHDGGNGTLLDYIEAMKVSAEQTGVSFINMYDELGITASNALQYMEDSIFLNENARGEYAKLVSEHLIQMK